MLVSNIFHNDDPLARVVQKKFPSLKDRATCAHTCDSVSRSASRVHNCSQRSSRVGLALVGIVLVAHHQRLE